MTHAKKPKTEKQIRKWLADPYSDAAEYKLWGNGIRTNSLHLKATWTASEHEKSPLSLV